MAMTNTERVKRALDLVREGLRPFVEQQLQAAWGAEWVEKLRERSRGLRREKDGLRWDSQLLLNTLFHNWHDVFRSVLGDNDRTYARELLDIRNRYAHEERFSYDQTLRALDTARLLLGAVSAGTQAEEISAMHRELMRTMLSEETRAQTRRRSAAALEGAPAAGLRPWREVANPHPDVSSGDFTQAEFAADLGQVLEGRASAEYGDARDFFRRTYLTEGLKHLLRSAMQRLLRHGGNPVVELQTNFGGGKTHSMLALYHLFGAGEDAWELAGVEDLLTKLNIQQLPRGKCAVLVGTLRGPSDPNRKPDGTVVRTLWGELAWQLGGADGFAMLAESDAGGTAPGSNLLAKLLEAHAPCLVLIDEWIAFVRQLYNAPATQAGSFDANLTFAQSLTEAAKSVPGAMVVASLPQSQIEIGGEGGKAALDRLKSTFRRLESSWRPATSEEGSEIVRRRLFEPISDPAALAARDAVIKAFVRLYAESAGEFPKGCGEGEYKRRMERSYPVHPELFERLYNTWGALDKFQRTRGVLRLMASAIHTLWQRQDSSLLIMPSSLPMDNQLVQSEMQNHLAQSWSAVLSSDVDGESSTPIRIDNEIRSLGRYSATRRVARTLFVGSAPTYETAPNPGMDERQVRLGCAQPGETPQSFGDALRRLADRASYLYQDGPRYWFATKASAMRQAEDRADALPDREVQDEIIGSLRKAARTRGNFAGVHAAPGSSADVPDEPETRLVVLGPKHPHGKSEQSRAQDAAAEILQKRGEAPRALRNTLVFLAPAESALLELEDAVRLKLAWASIVADAKRETLELDSHQFRQAEKKRNELEETVDQRILETWSVLLAPSPPLGTPLGNPEWTVHRVRESRSLAERVSNRLMRDELLFAELGPKRLLQELENHDLWRGGERISVQRLWEDFCTYLYLPRLQSRKVLCGAIETALGELDNDFFGCANSYDEESGRYEGLRIRGTGAVDINSRCVLVKPDEAARALREAEPGSAGQAPAEARQRPPEAPGAAPPPAPAGEARLPKRFFGSVKLDETRPARDLDRIVDEVIRHLTVPGASITLALEISATLEDGAPAELQRTVIENCNTLKFSSRGFEDDPE